VAVVVIPAAVAMDSANSRCRKRGDNKIQPITAVNLAALQD
jgi:hypothetical protein